MMNTLANHGYLPRDGRGISSGVLVRALASALNFEGSLAEIMFEHAIIVNPEPKATSFTLYVCFNIPKVTRLQARGSVAYNDLYGTSDQLNRHNVLEHDASLR